MRVGLWRKLSTEELTLLNCGVGEDFEIPLDCEEAQPVYPKGDQSWVFFGRTDAEAETPVPWPLHVKSWLTGKNSDAGRDWGQEGKGTTEDEMAGWHHWLDGRESEWTLGVDDGQGSLECCNSWGHKESNMTEWLNWTAGPTCKKHQGTFVSLEITKTPSFLGNPNVFTGSHSIPQNIACMPS